MNQDELKKRRVMDDLRKLEDKNKLLNALIKGEKPTYYIKEH
jgi:hypothetical protein